MIIILAVDDKGGMLFNGRRQSQDRVLKERILNMTKDSCLWMNQYTAKLFATMDNIQNLAVDEEFLTKAGSGEYCFIENVPTAPYLDKIEKVILYKWNRTYPGDLYFDIDLSERSWKLETTEEFQGSSHERITEEIYRYENS